MQVGVAEERLAESAEGTGRAAVQLGRLGEEDDGLAISLLGEPDAAQFQEDLEFLGTVTLLLSQQLDVDVVAPVVLLELEAQVAYLFQELNVAFVGF